jgi:hypothetical protein
VEPGKGFKKSVAEFLLESRTIIAYKIGRFTFHDSSSKFDSGIRDFRGEFPGILEKVIQNGMKKRRIAANMDTGFDGKLDMPLRFLPL